MARTRGLGSGAAVSAVKRATPTWASTSPTDEAPDSPRAAAPPSIVSALRAANPTPDHPGAARILTVRPDEVAEHPKNPRQTLGDLDKLTDSLRTFGLVQPIVVIPSQDYLARYPEHGGAIGSRPWVVVAGHRRRAAAELAGLRGIEAFIRADLADEVAAATTFVVENVHRAELQPLEEARTYALLADLGLSQREIAARCSVSQSHVSKRQSLTRLPQEAQDALTAGQLTIGEALTLASAPVQDQALLWGMSIERGIPVATAQAQLIQQREDHERVQTARAQAAKAGVRLIEPGREFGKDSRRHRLYEASDVDDARAAGDLVAAATGQGLVYYSLTEAIPAESADAAERRRTIHARREACQVLVGSAPTPEEALQDLARATLSAKAVDAEAAELAATWLPQLGGADPVGEGGGAAWLEAVAAADGPTRTWAAWALTVAQDELETTRAESGDRSERERHHVARLASRAGYHDEPARPTR